MVAKKLDKAKKTQRYQAVGNSWAVPVINWLGNRLVNIKTEKSLIDFDKSEFCLIKKEVPGGFYICLNDDVTGGFNCSVMKDEPIFKDIKEIFEINEDESIFISPVGCHGILRRKTERNININKRLEKYLIDISSTMTMEEIERRSRVQKRGSKSSDNVKFQQEIEFHEAS